MGHKHQDETQPPIQPTQAQVEESVQSGTADLPPDSQELRNGRSLLGRGVRINIARELTVVLSNYDLTTDTYSGKVINADKAESSTPFKDGEYVTGLRRYPYTARPDYAYQFVFPGEDESVLANISNKNRQDRRPTEVTSEE